MKSETKQRLFVFVYFLVKQYNNMREERSLGVAVVLEVSVVLAGLYGQSLVSQATVPLLVPAEDVWVTTAGSRLFLRTALLTL